MARRRKLNSHYVRSVRATRIPARQPSLSLVPTYRTSFGAAYTVDSRELLAELPSDSVDLVLTSPPYALHFKKEYGNVEKHGYVAWFLPFARDSSRSQARRKLCSKHRWQLQSEGADPIPLPTESHHASRTR
jgi:hypothetical protein